jgi:hypothetical protein
MILTALGSVLAQGRVLGEKNTFVDDIEGCGGEWHIPRRRRFVGVKTSL